MARLQGAVVASSQCFGTSGRLALAPVADWLRNPAVQSAAAALDPAWRAEVGRLMPGGEHGGRGSGPRAMADAWQRHRFFEGLARALLAVGRPTLLVLDNMQWCDQETLAFITFCLRLADGSPLLVAGTLRDDDLGEDPELGDWTVRMRATGLLTELSLGPLDAADTAQLAEAISGQPLPAADADLLHATTGGFPLYVIEAVRSTADPGGTAAGRRPRGGAAQALRAGDRGRPGRWPVSRRRWAPTSPLTCSPRRATSRPTPSWRPSTSCGGAGSCGSSVTVTTSPTTCSARRRTRASARRNAGCCTGASPRGSSCSTPTTPTRSRPSSPSSTPGAGGRRPGAGLLPARGRRRGGPVRPRRGDPAAPGGAVDHRGHARGAGPGLARARGPRGDGGTAQRQARLLVPGPAAGPGALDRPRRVTWPQGLDGHRPGRAVGVAVRPGAHRRRVPDGQPRPGPRRPRLRAERPGPLRRRRVGRQPGDARRGAAPPGARRQAGAAVPSR